MTIHVTCTACGEKYALKDTAAGKFFACKVCGAELQAPGEPGGDTILQETGDRPTRSRSEVASRTFLPAVFLYIVAALSLVNHGAGLVMAAMGHNLNPFANLNANQNPDAVQARAVGAQVGGIIGGIVGLLLDTVVILGARALQRLEGYGMAMSGAIVAIIPCLSPCLILGMPFGIWALVLLSSQDVKSAFR